MGAASSGYRQQASAMGASGHADRVSVAAIDVHEGWISRGKRTAAGGAGPLATARDDTAFASALASLTKRQRQIVHLRAQGMTIAEICDHCFLSENTVKNHLHGAFRTLGLGGLRHQARLGRACYLLGRYEAMREGGSARRVGSRKS